MARWVYFNPNPEGKRVGDCAVRALCKALGQDWEQVYTGLCLEGFALGDMPRRTGYGALICAARASAAAPCRKPARTAIPWRISRLTIPRGFMCCPPPATLLSLIHI